ncbi:hypothetical protein CF319_g7875 [Tilletia indica]|nr:hypothetical protein CF319_g7875 [Tilletia indica]
MIGYMASWEQVKVCLHSRQSSLAENAHPPLALSTADHPDNSIMPQETTDIALHGVPPPIPLMDVLVQLSLLNKPKGSLALATSPCSRLLGHTANAWTNSRGRPWRWYGLELEMMGKYFPLEEISAIYLIDLCEPLLKVARERFAHLGFNDVQVLCQDAQEFSLPGLSDGRKVDLFTCSYSISMMPPIHAILDRINEFLDPDTCTFGVVDFYVSAASTPRDKAPAVGGDTTRQCGWLSCLFWSQWFSLDHIELHPARRDYLEYKFGTIECYNGRNNFIIPSIVRVPYYIWTSRMGLTCRHIEYHDHRSSPTVHSPTRSIANRRARRRKISSL